VHVLVIAALLQAPPVLPLEVDSRRYAGIGIAMAGVAVITGGVVSAQVSSRQYQLAVEATDVVSSFGHFSQAQTAYQAGWGIGIAGAVTLVAGILIALIPASYWPF
jgi:hypothetical protein